VLISCGTDFLLLKELVVGLLLLWYGIKCTFLQCVKIKKIHAPVKIRTQSFVPNSIALTCYVYDYRNIPIVNLCEFNSVDRDITYYMQELGFEPQTPHFSTFKMCELALGYLKKYINVNVHPYMCVWKFFF